MGTRQPSPRDARGHWTLKGAWKPGTAFTNGAAITIDVPCAGAERIRIRMKTATGGGTLAAAWLRPDGETKYTANNPADVAIVAGTENKMDVDPHFGEGLLRLTFTPSADGTITYVDVSQTG